MSNTERPTRPTHAFDVMEWKQYADEADTDYDAFRKRVAEVLRDMCEYPVVLSAEYLKTFEKEPDDKCVQGWDLGRWRKALVAKKAADELLEETTDE